MSMNKPDDLLTRATRAMRDTTASLQDADVEDASVPSASGAAANDEAVPSPAKTLARVERSTRGQRVTKLRRRRYTQWVVMPMAASFIVFCAWASASGRLSQWVSSRSHLEEERAQEQQGAAHPQPQPQPQPKPVIATPPPSASAPEEEPDPRIIEEPLRKPVAKPAPSVDVDALYRDAHDAHFVRRDPAAALAGWDRYLAAAGPSGRFTLEARYNRAISLVRLGRKAEAAAALRPFANGDYGGYRRDEARELLKTLE